VDLEYRLKIMMSAPLHSFFGMDSIHTENGHARMSIELHEHLLDALGAFHAGALYGISDICAYGALASVIPRDIEAVTHDIHVSVVRPAKAGDRVDFEAEVIKLGKRLAFMNVDARVRGELISSARVTKSLLKLVPSSE
jgi:uncharacterized protein (TIGR00369 family)